MAPYLNNVVNLSKITSKSKNTVLSERKQKNNRIQKLIRFFKKKILSVINGETSKLNENL